MKFVVTELPTKRQLCPYYTQIVEPREVSLPQDNCSFMIMGADLIDWCGLKQEPCNLDIANNECLGLAKK